MSVYKRGKYYWVQFRAPNGERIHQSTKTENRRSAQEYEDKLKSEIWRVQKLGERPRMMWNDAVIRYVQESKRGASDDVISIFNVLEPYLSSLTLDEIDRNTVDGIIAGRRNDGVSNNTINKALEKIRVILNKAHREWEVLTAEIYIKLLPISRKRIRWLTQIEANRLINALPGHIASMCEFSLETGLREANVTGLRWDQIDRSQGLIFIEADDVLKNWKDFVVPLSERAAEIIMQQIGKHSTYVFTYRGRPIKKAGTKSFRKVADRVGLNDFRWHDLRHTWATWHVQNGTPLDILQELGGWSDYKMVKRYAHYSNQHLKKWVNGASGKNSVTTLSPLKYRQ